MALEIAKLYITLMSEFFSLSDPAVKSKDREKKPADPLAGTSAAFVPRGTTSLTAAHYMARMVGEIAECVSDVTGMEISSEANFGLNNLLISARWRFEDVLCDLWLRGEYFRRLIVCQYTE